MSLITASEYLTPCEYLKKINDVCQGNNEKDVKIRELVAMSERLSKEMSIALHEYEPDFYKRYSKNNTCVKDKELRSKYGYKYHKLV